MTDCTTVFETLKGFLPMNIMEKAVDETIIRQSITLFPWASYRDKTAAVKVHTLYDRYCKEGIFSISRLKKNAVIQVLNENAVKRGGSVLYDYNGKRKSDKKIELFKVDDTE